MEDCLFCKIANKEIASSIVYEDKDVVAFRDIKPKARVHILVVPTLHIESFLALQDNQFEMLTKMAKVVQTLIKGQKIEGSYHLVINGGKRQEIAHIHWHLLGD